MTKYQALTQAMLIFMGGYAIMNMVRYTIMFIQQSLSLFDLSITFAIYTAFSLFTAGGFIFACLTFLMLKNQRLAQRICPESKEANLCSPLWLAGCLRVSVVLLGLLMVRQCIYVPLHVLGFLFHENGLRHVTQYTISQGVTWESLKNILEMPHSQIEAPVQLAISVYLIVGAPHLIQYHLRSRYHTSFNVRDSHE